MPALHRRLPQDQTPTSERNMSACTTRTQALPQRSGSRSLAALVCGCPTAFGHGAQEVANAPRSVRTDWSSKQGAVGHEVGGASLGVWITRATCGAVCGIVQTAAMVEVYVALAAISHATAPLLTGTDSMSVYRQLRRLRRGGGGREACCSMASGGTSFAQGRRRRMLQCAPYIGGVQCARAVGCPVQWHGLNGGADALAASGVALHTDDLARVATTHKLIA